MIAVNGPARSTTCNACHKDVPLTPALWGEQLSCASRGSDMINNPYRCLAVGNNERTPICPKCEEPFSFDSAWLDHDYDFACPHCGFEVTTYPAPDWLKAELPALRQVVGGDRPTPDGRLQTLQTDDQATKPVVLSCPNCAASLKVTEASERTIDCEHCGVDVYLPDGLWIRLHPVQTVHPWTVIFEDELETAEDLRERQAKEAREQQQQLQMVVREEAREEARRKEKRQVLIIGFTIFGVTLLIFVVIVALFHL